MAKRYTSLVVTLITISLAMSGCANFDPTTLFSSCTVTINEGNIQTMIKDVPSGAVVCLGTNTWDVNLTIKKSLTLRGSEDGSTNLNGVTQGHAVVSVIGSTSIEVYFENLVIRNAQGEICDFEGKSCPAGIFIVGDANVTLDSTEVSGNGHVGILAGGPTKLKLVDSTIAENGLGGVTILQQGHSDIINTRIDDNGFAGVTLRDNSSASIQGTSISDNLSSGTSICASSADDCHAKASIDSSRLSRNMHGISVASNAKLNVANTEIKNNRNWGIKAHLPKCYPYDIAEDNFSGKVSLGTGNTISDNQEGSACLPTP